MGRGCRPSRASSRHRNSPHLLSGMSLPLQLPSPPPAQCLVRLLKISESAPHSQEHTFRSSETRIPNLKS